MIDYKLLDDETYAIYDSYGSEILIPVKAFGDFGDVVGKMAMEIMFEELAAPLRQRIRALTTENARLRKQET